MDSAVWAQVTTPDDFAGADAMVEALDGELMLIGYEVPFEERRDSVFGAGTFAVLARFQKERGMATTGVVDAQTARWTRCWLRRRSRSKAGSRAFNFLAKEVTMQKVDSVLDFDGIDDYIEIPDSPDFSVATTGELTVLTNITNRIFK